MSSISNLGSLHHNCLNFCVYFRRLRWLQKSSFRLPETNSFFKVFLGFFFQVDCEIKDFFSQKVSPDYQKRSGFGIFITSYLQKLKIYQKLKATYLTLFKTVEESSTKQQILSRFLYNQQGKAAKLVSFKHNRK